MRVLLAAVAALVGLSVLVPEEPRATTPPRPTPVVVALGLGQPALQAGVVRGREVILARGFEVELTRALAQRLGTRVGRFVYVPAATRLLASGSSGWQLAVAGLQRAPGRGGTSALTAPYLTTDVAVVARRGLPRPRSLAALRTRVLCASRGSDGVAALTTLRPRTSPLVVVGADRLRDLLRTGVCDAALVPSFDAGRFVAGQRRLLGPVVGRIRRGDGLGLAVRRGGGLDVATVNRALVGLRRDGTLARLARTWLGLDPAALPRLR